MQFAMTRDGFDGSLKALITRLVDDLGSTGLRVLSAHRHESFGRMDVKGQAASVVRRDFRWMSEADAFVALFPLDDESRSIRSDGTCVELGLASAMRRPIVVVRPAAHASSHLIEELPALVPTIILIYEEVLLDTGLVREAVSRVPEMISHAGEKSAPAMTVRT